MRRTSMVFLALLCFVVFAPAYVFSVTASPSYTVMLSRDTDRFIGTYRREFIGASGRVVELLDLKADLSATMTGDYENRGNVVRTGNWTFARSRVIVTFAPIDVGGTPLVLEFTRSGGGWFRSGNNLKVTSSNPSGFVPTGIVYKRISRG